MHARCQLVTLQDRQFRGNSILAGLLVSLLWRFIGMKFAVQLFSASVREADLVLF